MVRQFTALSEQELDRIETLVQNLLKVTKLDAGTVLMEKSEQRVAELMQALGQRFSIQAERQGKRLIFSGGEHVVLFCDAHWIGEALSNLIKNALDHTWTGDFIQIEWCTFASVVQIKVRDTGCGIHPEDLPHIFKRFYRSRFSKDTQGAGLGLALTKSIVEGTRRNHRSGQSTRSRHSVHHEFSDSYKIVGCMSWSSRVPMVLFFHTKRKRGSEMNLLYVDHVSKTYGQGETAVHALKEACFSVPKGEFVAIVGESGSARALC